MDDRDMTTWCPKHGVAHGICVDPVPVGAVNSENDFSEAFEPNRFDPYEALDIILSFVGPDTDLDRDGADTVRHNVYALRAYITGMER